MPSNPQYDNIMSHLGAIAAGRIFDHPINPQGIYSCIYQMPTSPTDEVSLALRIFSHGKLVKVFKQHAIDGGQADVGAMLTSLMGLQEAQPAAFRHPNIVPFLFTDINELTHGGVVAVKAMVSPWYSSGDVLTYTRTHPRTPKITLALQTAMAIEHLHSHDIVHGNLYPGNVLVNNERQAVITDISVYTLASQHLLYAHATVPLSPSSVYQPPEILGADAFVQPTKEVDIYSLASTIFAIFAEKAPFQDVDSIRLPEQAIGKILRFGHLHLQKPASIGNELWELLRKCWALDPAARPRIADVVIALEDIELYN